MNMTVSLSEPVLKGSGGEGGGKAQHLRLIFHWSVVVGVLFSTGQANYMHGTAADWHPEPRAHTAQTAGQSSSVGNMKGTTSKNIPQSLCLSRRSVRVTIAVNTTALLRSGFSNNALEFKKSTKLRHLLFFTIFS